MDATHSKSRIDRAGQLLANETYLTVEDLVESEDAFDFYRTSHLPPITKVTLQLQSWLADYGESYYIAQRLKRKPQILRKLRRFRSRLTQLQDIGGCRIIVQKNEDVDRLRDYILAQAEKSSTFSVFKKTDYRGKGRDDSGYRALHILLKQDGALLELQIRSKIQHYWAESIERTSVVYGHYLKEQEGDPAVLAYFKLLSDIFFILESDHVPDGKQQTELEQLRSRAEEIIRSSAKSAVFDSFVNEGIIKTLQEKEQKQGGTFNNWLLIFDWNQGSFVSWDIVDRQPKEAARAYSIAENHFRAEDGFEVVMIGSSDVKTVRETHSHYFGIETYETILENLEASVKGFSRKMDLDIGARQILLRLHSRHVWGKRSVSEATLKNHFCKGVITFDSSLGVLLDKQLLIRDSPGGALLLNMKLKSEIERYIAGEH